MAKVTLKPGHVQPVWAGHPWVYAQAVQRVEGGASAGDEVDVLDPRGNFLGRGLYNPASAIPVRLYTRQPGVAFDGALVTRRLAAAQQRRTVAGLPAPGTTGYRLVHADGDDLPGLVVDRFDDVLVVQFGTLGIKAREPLLLDALRATTGASTIIDRTSPALARAEGFDARSGVVHGHPLQDGLSFTELGLEYRLPLGLGQKTGFYFDQRPLRARVGQLANGRRVLDTYSYVGALALAAARGGAAEVQAVDNSVPALEVGAEIAQANGLHQRISFVRSDAREALARAGRQGGFDLVICDPPKLAPTRAARKRALGHMRQLAQLACQATTSGGLTILTSCSAALDVQDVTRALALGARDANLHVVVLDRVFQGADHPVPAAFPEGLYLSTVIAQVTPRSLV